jgi:hypothetical protein
LVCLLKGSRIGNRIPKEQGKGIIKKRQNAKQGKIEITHMNTTKGTGTQKQQSTENKNVHE